VTEFLFYDQSYMPLTVLDEAVRVVGQPQVSARLDPDLSGFVRNAANTAKLMQGTLEKAAKCGGLNAFELKGLVGEIAIMPAYLFQAQGEMISKPEAIRRAGELYSPHALRALEWATLVREEFAPLVHNRRMRFLKTVARLACARRQHAEALFRRYAVWVSNEHSLGLNAGVMEAVETFIQESHSLIMGLED
jgi:hypothetical protein